MSIKTPEEAHRGRIHLPTSRALRWRCRRPTRSTRRSRARCLFASGDVLPVGPVETILTGGTSLRYDSTGGQFSQNWQTPKKPGTCAVATTTMQDGSPITSR